MSGARPPATLREMYEAMSRVGLSPDLIAAQLQFNWKLIEELERLTADVERLKRIESCRR